MLNLLAAVSPDSWPFSLDSANSLYKVGDGCRIDLSAAARLDKRDDRESCGADVVDVLVKIGLSDDEDEDELCGGKQVFTNLVLELP
jgi:hypothetical protein